MYPQTNSTLQIEFGYALDPNNPIILLENGEGVLKSDLVSISDLRANPSKAIIINWSNSNPIFITYQTNFTSYIQFCRQPIETAFCMDYRNVSDTIATKNVYSLIFPNFQIRQFLSAYSCNQYCSGMGYQVG